MATNNGQIKKGEHRGVEFSSERQPKNRRKPNIVNQIKKIPDDAQQKIYEILHEALSMKNFKDAEKYLQKESVNCEYGFILQLAVRSLGGKNGWQVFNSIMDRLYGKPKETHELNGDGLQIVLPKISAEDIDELKRINGI